MKKDLTRATTASMASPYHVSKCKLNLGNEDLELRMVSQDVPEVMHDKERMQPARGVRAPALRANLKNRRT